MEDYEKQEFEDVAKLVKSTIISKPGGLPLRDLNADFKEIMGYPVPFKKFNYSCLKDYLKSIPGIRIFRGRNNLQMIEVNDTKANHIATLVENQKVRVSQRSKGIANRQSDNRYNSNNRGVNFKTAKNTQNRRSRSTSTSTRISSKSDSCSDVRSYGSRGSSRTSNIEIKIDPLRRMKNVCEPIAYHQQLIGDDFFLQLAIRELHVNNLWRKHDKSAITTGLCVSGQTIKDCVRRLKQIDNISSRVVILLGAVDIYKGRDINQMMHDMDELLSLCLNKFMLSKSAITLCTIPPLANIPLFCDHERLSTLYCFNKYIKWLIDQDKSSHFSYGFLDFFREFNCHYGENESIDFDLFQVEARMVSGCSHPHVLWNKQGRQKAMRLLCSRLGDFDTRTPIYAW